MLKNYFLTALRTFKKNKVFTLVNVFGLSVGIAFFILVAVFVRDELRYDKFHSQVDRIYRGISVHNRGFIFGIPDKAVDLAAEQMPEIEDFTSIDFGTRAIVEFEGKKIFEPECYRADPGIFRIFDFSLAQGDPETALLREEDLVISQQMANKYFPGKNAIGQSLKLFNDDKTYTISGVLNDIPKNSRYQFNFIRRFSKNERYDQWNPSGLTYVLLNEQVDATAFGERMKALSIDNGYKGAEDLNYLIEPFGDLYLNSEFSFTASGVSGDRNMISIFSVVAIVLLVIASINYINSATARILTRTHEIGVRKVLGASRRQINLHYLFETISVVVLAVCVAAGLAEAMLPKLNDLTDKMIVLDYFGDPFVLVLMVSIVVLVTTLAGLYPALFAGRFNEMSLMNPHQNGRKALLRKSLVVFQFVATLTLIFSSQIINKQLKLFLDGDVGFDPENVLIVQLSDKTTFPVIKSAMELVPGVEAVFGSPMPNVAGTSLIGHQYLSETGESEEVLAHQTMVSPDFLEQMKIEVVSGRGFDKDNGADMRNSLLVSETVAKKLPWPDPIGKELEYNFLNGDEKRTIIGVFADLRNSLKSDPLPLIMVPEELHYRLNIKISSPNQEETIEGLRTVWADTYPDIPMEMVYLEDRVKASYDKERKFGEVFLYFTYITIVIAVIGLLGLSSFTLLQRYKEIGVRKVLGASVSGLVMKLFKSYLSLIAISSLVAIPLGFVLMDRWLQDFASRIMISPLIFLVGLILGILILAVTVGFQTIKAARLNPVDILRNE